MWRRAALLSLWTAVAHAEPPPVEAFFANPRFEDLRTSPSGASAAMILNVGDAQRLLVRAPGMSDWAPVAALSDPEVRFSWLEWESERTLLIGAALRDPFSIGVRARATRLFSFDLEEKKLRWVGRKWTNTQVALGQYIPVSRQDEIHHSLPDKPEKVLISYRVPTEMEPSLRVLSVLTGNLAPAQGSVRGIHDWHVDAQGKARAGEGYANGRYKLWVRARQEDDLELVQDSDRFGGEGFSRSRV